MVESELNELFRKSPNYRIVLEAEERIENGSKRYVIPDPIVERVMLK